MRFLTLLFCSCLGTFLILLVVTNKTKQTESRPDRREEVQLGRLHLLCKMPNWYWEKKELRATPSQAPQGPNTAGTTSTSAAVGGASAQGQAGAGRNGNKIEYETEMRYRREGARFIIELGKKLNLSHNTMATGAVYFHRFYMFHSFVDFPKYVSRGPFHVGLLETSLCKIEIKQ